MSVAEHLGLDDPDRGLLAQARAGWPSWSRLQPQLAVVAELVDLPAWILTADREKVDQVLLELARLGSPTGADDAAAAGALCWLLLPGACLAANRMRSLTARIDECVAAQLWLEVRAFPWHRGHKVAANVVWNLRRGVLRDLGMTEPGRASDPTWARSIPVAPDAELWAFLDARSPVEEQAEAADELAEIVSAALAYGALARPDVELLLQLAHEASRADVARNREGRAGLCSRAASRAVAARQGISEATVRRRARHGVQVLAQVHAELLSA